MRARFPRLRGVLARPGASETATQKAECLRTKGGMPLRKNAMRATAYFAAEGDARANRAGDALRMGRGLPALISQLPFFDTLARLLQFWSEMA